MPAWFNIVWCGASGKLPFVRSMLAIKMLHRLRFCTIAYTQHTWLETIVLEQCSTATADARVDSHKSTNYFWFSMYNLIIIWKNFDLAKQSYHFIQKLTFYSNFFSNTNFSGGLFYTIETKCQRIDRCEVKQKMATLTWLTYFERPSRNGKTFLFQCNVTEITLKKNNRNQFVNFQINH